MDIGAAQLTSAAFNQGDAMRFIVDIFRYVIFAVCGLAIIGGVLLILLVATSSGGLNITTGVMLAVVGGLLFLVLNVGGIAVIVSMNDRYAEMVSEARQLNAMLSDLINERVLQIGLRGDNQ